MGTAPASEQAVKNTRSRRRIPGVCAAAIARAWMRRRMVGSSPHHGASVVACGQPLSRQAARAWALRALGTRYPVAAHRTAGSRPPDSPTRAGRAALVDRLPQCPLSRGHRRAARQCTALMTTPTAPHAIDRACSCASDHTTALLVLPHCSAAAHSMRVPCSRPLPRPRA